MNKDSQIDPKAMELFRKSKHASMVHGGLPIRVSSAITRAGYAISDGDGKVTYDIEGIKRALSDGSIWYWRNVGERTIMTICEWLVAMDKASDV